MSLTKEQRARVFAMYYPHKLQCFKEWSKEKGYYYPFVKLDSNIHCIQQAELGMKNAFLLLTPLSAISDEQRTTAVMIFHNERPWINERKLSRKEAERYKGSATEPVYLFDANVRQYYISEGIAVPLFIEVGHPDIG
jgi:hypothetical protein